LNDDQRDKMIKVLAAAFDRAATTSPTAYDAALRILTALDMAGYNIKIRAQPLRRLAS
jgi:hypothetical protein